MADDYRALTQCCGQRLALVLRMTRKDKIGGGRQHVETEPEQSAIEPRAAFDHASPALLKPGFVLQRGDGAAWAGRPRG